MKKGNTKKDAKRMALQKLVKKAGKKPVASQPSYA